jgi:Rieske Fe-S protein
MAVSRDENYNLHAVSPVCTHMKCIVHWNSFEKTWDCPCHGSRFSMDGEVIYGPAVTGLEKKEIKMKQESK